MQAALLMTVIAKCKMSVIIIPEIAAQKTMVNYHKTWRLINAGRAAHPQHGAGWGNSYFCPEKAVRRLH